MEGLERGPRARLRMMGRLKALTYAFVSLVSLTFALVVSASLSLPLLVLNRRYYRRLTDLVAVNWQHLNVSVLEVLLGARVVVSGDTPISSTECSLIVVNHQSFWDWNALGALLCHSFHPLDFSPRPVLRDRLKKLPVIGWALQLLGRCLFIKGIWKCDEQQIGQVLDHFAATDAEDHLRAAASENTPAQVSVGAAGKGFQVVLFPEGTPKSPESIAKSDEFAKKNSLKPLKHLLQPRTVGFSYIASKLRENRNLDAVYDVTLFYPDKAPGSWQEFFSEGVFPGEVHIHVRRINLHHVPTTLIGLEKWVQELWREKDLLLEHARTTGGFQLEGYNGPRLQGPLPHQYTVLVGWWVTIVWALGSFQFGLPTSIASGAVWAWASVLCPLFMWFICDRTEGLLDLEMALDRGGVLKHLWKWFSATDRGTNCREKPFETLGEDSKAK